MLDLVRLASLCLSPDSGMSSVDCSIHLALQPSCLADVRAGVVNLLNTKLNQYYPELKGILMGFEKIKIKSREGVLFNDNPFIHLDISSKFYVFKPVSGSLLRGRVNKKSPGHVGCLVHDTFNAAIIAPRGEDLTTWCGRNAQLGKQMIFTTTAVMFSGALPSILGTITEEGVNAEEEQFKLDYDSGFGSTSKNKIAQNQHGERIKKRTKTKNKLEEMENGEQRNKAIKLEEQEDGNCDKTKNVKKKKKEKKHKNKT